MSSERWLALAAFLGMTLLMAGIAGWFVKPPRVLHVAQQSVRAVSAGVTAIELPPVLVEAGYFDQLRDRIRWVPTRIGRHMMMAPDFASRMLLAKSAADRAGLGEVGLTYRDVYGIINAETSWAPRAGASLDGTPNLGIAQFEPATAKALGLRDPEDAVEAVHAVALHMKEAALWSNDRLKGLKLGKVERAEKLREGISIYYNLSTRGRNLWNGRNTAQLPVQTQRHIVNARLGAQEAAMLDAQLRASEAARGREVMTASGNDSRT
jgi:hypothetical protein